MNSGLVLELDEFLKVIEARNRPPREVLDEYERKYGAQVRARSSDFSARSKNADTVIAQCIADGPKSVAEIHVIVNYLMAMEG